jgi:CheY-like chemotaxis protein
MPSFHIAVIEDCEGTRGILNERLLEKIKEVSGVSLPAWPDAVDIRFEIEPVGQEVIDGLAAVEKPDEALPLLEGHFAARDHLTPNLLILDLALTGEQAKALDCAGGGDAMGIEDPGEALEKTGGFIALQAWDDRCPTLVTTYAKNPHVVTRCLDAGAHDVVIKPLPDADMTSVHHTFMDLKANVAKPREDEVHEAEEHKAAVDAYVRCVAHEILKAVRMSALHGLEGTAPAHVPFWLATDLARFDPEVVDGTNLMLIDIRGFSEMMQRGRSEPIAVFDLMNAIWAEVFKLLKTHGAEVNNIIGDAALAFRGVYGVEREQASLADTLTCARTISELFEPGGKLRSTLVNIVNERYEALVHKESRAHPEMLELVGGQDFGVRVISIEPDAREALYGKVGASHRWQHTILSRFMNFLARGEAEISRWEREEDYQHRPGESFLLWRMDKELPVFDGFSFEPPQEFRGQKRGKIRDLPDDVEVLRVVPPTDLVGT